MTSYGKTTRFLTIALIATFVLAGCAGSAASSAPAVSSAAPSTAGAAESPQPAPTEGGATQSPRPGTKEFTIASIGKAMSDVPLLAALDEMRADGYTIEFPAL